MVVLAVAGVVVAAAAEEAEAEAEAAELEAVDGEVAAVAAPPDAKVPLENPGGVRGGVGVG